MRTLTGDFTQQAEELAPDPDVILVDGDELLGLLEELDRWGIVAAYFDDLDPHKDVDRGCGSNEAEAGATTSRYRFNCALESLFS